MIDDNINLSLNVAALPKKRQKAKQDNHIEKPYGTTEVTTSTADSEVPRWSRKVSSKSISKESKISPWKDFKKANKKINKNHVTSVADSGSVTDANVKTKKSVTWTSSSVVSLENSEDGDGSDGVGVYNYNKNTLKKGKRKNEIPLEDIGSDDEVNNFHLKVKKDYIPGKQSSLFGNNPEIPQIPHRAVKPMKEPVFSNLCFSDMSLHPYMVKYLDESMGLTKMTMVQQRSIPVLLEKKDALIRSQTGSGKTLAFALPVLHHLQEVRPKINRTDGVMALVVVPTRELALQTYEVFNKLVKSYTWIVPGYLVGGEKRKSEKARLRKGISILIGTPGRLVDHIQNTQCLSLEKVRYLVLDEADRLFDLGYEKDVSSVIATLDKGKTSLLNPGYLNTEREKVESVPRHTMLLSATLTANVMQLAGLSLTDPVFVDACDGKRSVSGSVPIFNADEEDNTEAVALPESLLQQYVVVPAKLRLVVLSALILWRCKLTNEKKMLVFVATQDMVDYHSELLSTALSVPGQDDSDAEEGGSPSTAGVEFFKLHGSMNQKERTDVFNTFRKADSGVLFCTDVAARGLDLPEVDWVVQYTGPTSLPDYVHRVGRTARGGQPGSSIIFLLPSEVNFIGQLEDQRIRLAEEKMDNILRQLLKLSPDARTVEESASSLQANFEAVVAEQPRMRDMACKAYSSWCRFYSCYPRNMKKSFSIKSVHQGHYAKSFALRDSPTEVVNRARGMSLGDKRRTKDRMRRPDPAGPPGAKRRANQVSEFDSGLEPLRKKVK